MSERDQQAKLKAAELTEAWRKARQLLRDKNSQLKQREDKKRRDHHFLEGDMVYLSSKNFSWKHGTKKMCPRWMGPFKVLEVKGPVTYKLQLPEEWKIHNVFHSSLLKPVPEGTRYHFPKPTVDDDGQPCWEVDQIIKHKMMNPKNKRSTRKRYLVA